MSEPYKVYRAKLVYIEVTEGEIGARSREEAREAVLNDWIGAGRGESYVELEEIDDA